jgi:hypothetical protein
MSQPPKIHLGKTPERDQDHHPTKSDESNHVPLPDKDKSIRGELHGNSRVVAAYDVGRRRQRLGSHMEWAWFGADSYEYNDIIPITAKELGRRARILRSTAESREEIQRGVNSTIFKFERAWKSKEHRELQAEYKAIDLLNYRKDEGILDRYIDLFLILQSSFGSILSPLSEILESGLEDSDCLSMRLGESVEVGMSLGKMLDRYLDVLCQRIHQFKSSLNSISSGSLDNPLIINHYDQWFNDIIQRASELDILEALPQEVLRLPVQERKAGQNATEVEFLEFVDRLATAIRTALAVRCLPDQVKSENKLPPSMITKDRRPSIPGDEANILVREYLEDRPTATAREISRNTGVSLGGVVNTPCWRVQMEKKESEGTKRGKTARPLTKKILATRSSGSDPADDVEAKELAQRRYLESATDKERSEYFSMPPSKQSEVLRLYAEQIEDQRDQLADR